jgi:pilus assembly protein CpaB
LGSAISAEQIKRVEWPRGALPSGAIADEKKVLDRIARVALVRDEPILESRLAPPGVKPGLSALITPGKRAMAVRVNDVVGVAGFALPGNFVDVLVSLESEPGSGVRVSRIVLENILVLAAGDEAGRDETRPKVVKAVTLEVTPEQAEAVDLARSVGSLSLALRNQVDQASVKTAGATRERLLGAGPPRLPAARVANNCVEIFNGREASRQCLP